MFSRRRAAAPTEAVANPVPYDETFNVLVHGDSGAGKSMLLRRIAAPDVEPKPDPDTAERYWLSQSSPEPVFVTHRGVRVRFMEVEGSRGRAGNYHKLHAAYANADAVMFCAALDPEIRYNSVAQTIEWSQQTIDSMIENARARAKKDKADVAVGEIDRKPSFAFGTMAELRPADAEKVDEAKLRELSVTYYEVSAVTGAGVGEALHDMLDQALQRTEKGRRMLEAAPEKSRATPVPAPAPVPPAEKATAQALFRKFVMLVAGGKEANKRAKTGGVPLAPVA